MVWAYRFLTGLFRLMGAYYATYKATQAVQFFKCFYHITRLTFWFKICLYPVIIVTNKKWSKVSQTLYSLCNYSGNETKTAVVHFYGACSEDPMQLKSKLKIILIISLYYIVFLQVKSGHKII